MRSILHTSWSWLIPESLRRDAEKLRQANRILVFTGAMTVWIPVFAGLYAWLGANHCAAVIAVSGVLLTCIPPIQRVSGSPALAGNLLSFLAFSVYTVLAINLGGHASPPVFWYVSVPVFAALVAGVSWGVFWALACMAATGCFYWAYGTGFQLPSELPPREMAFVHSVGLSGLIVCIFVLTFVFKTLEATVQSRLELALRRAEAADQAKTEFLANMSHEIRTPMTAILGFADVLLHGAGRSGRLLEAEAEYLHTIQSNGQHLLQIINDILDLSKIEAGKMEVENIPCAPREVVTDVMALLRGRAEAKGLEFGSKIAADVPQVILSDPTRLRQILLNLVGNAVKFTEHGSVCTVVRCIRDPNGARLRFDVIDTGIGMSTEQASRVFTCFSQADSSTTRRFGGTGLGLAISRRFVEMLGGELELESRLGIGSRFSVELPVQPLFQPAMPTVQSQSKAEGDEAAAGGHRLHCRILLAEDGPDNQRLISHVLRKAGAEVSIADNGQLAVERALKEREAGSPFDVILMDMQMPVLSGYEAAAKLREQDYEGPIIALTAHAQTSDRQKCLEAGCDDYAAKPLELNTLFAAIERQLERRQGDNGCAPTRP